jgi:TPR repeat protein
MWHFLNKFRMKQLCSASALFGGYMLAVTCILSVPTFASELQAELELGAAKTYDQQQLFLISLQNDTSVAGQIKLAKELDKGSPFSQSNPLRRHRTSEAVALLRQLAGQLQGEEKLRVQKALYKILVRSDIKADREASAELLKAQPLVSRGELLLGADSAAKMSIADVENLKALLVSGSARAGFRIAELLADKSPAEAKTYREQALYLAAVDAQSGAESAVYLATLYINGNAGKKDATLALRAIKSAVAEGSDAALSLMDEHFNDPLFAGRADEMRSLIEEGLVAGSERAAELIVTDQLDKKRYGYSLEDALWVVGLLDEIQTPRSFYVSAKLFAEGKLVARDLGKAEEFLAKLSDVDDYTDDYQYLVAKRITNIDMAVQLQYKYALPIFVRMMSNGKDGAVNRVANMVNSAMRDGYFESVKELPVKPDALISELNKSYGAGDLTSAVILGDIYRQGLIAPQNVGIAAEFYTQVLAKNKDKDLELKVQERYARILRRGSQSGTAKKKYVETLRVLTGKGNLWAKKEYGSLLLTGLPDVADSAERGIELLFEDIDAGYYSASTRLLSFAVDNNRDDVKNRLVATYEALITKKPSPELTYELANAYRAVGRQKDAYVLLDKPEFSEDPEAIFLRSRIGLETSKLSLDEAVQGARRAIKISPAKEIKTLKYAKFILSNGVSGKGLDESALQIVTGFADQGDFDAITIGLKYLLQDIENHQERFSRIVPWVVREAADGRPELLLNLADTQLGNKISMESNALIGQAIVGNFPKMQGRGSASAVMARIYMNGFGVPRDDKKGREFLVQAAWLGNQSSLTEIGNSFLFGYGTERNSMKAAVVFEAAAALGSNKARIEQGRLYSTGFGSTFNELQSFAKNQQAAETGSLAGMIETGRAYMAGVGVEKNIEMGTYWLEKAANKRSPFAASQLYFYYLIQEPSVGNEKARFWLDKAIAFGHSPSLTRKAVLLEVEDPVGNATEVQALLNEAISRGHNLAKRYQTKIAKDKAKK